jgi:hypothetical protein
MQVSLLNKLGTNFRGCIVVHEKCEGLARDIGYPNIVEHLRVIKRDFSGDYEIRVTRMRGQNENVAIEGRSSYVALRRGKWRGFALAHSLLQFEVG